MLNHSYRLRAVPGLAHADDFLHSEGNYIDGRSFGHRRRDAPAKAQAPTARPIWYTAKLTNQAKAAV